MQDFINELHRRKVFRVGATYLVAAWLLVQVAWTITEILSLPDWFAISVLTVASIGFPIALALAWFYEITSDGLKKTKEADAQGLHARQPGRTFSYAVIALLTLMVSFLVWDGYLRDKGLGGAAIAAAPSIAVLPFADMSADGSQEYFADGISEEILNLLAKTDNLRVAARTSSFAFKGRNEDVREIGQALDVASVLEGSIRSSGTKLRITAQLINVSDGYHVWSETYDRELTDVFVVQDEISLAILEALKMHLLKGESPASMDPATDRPQKSVTHNMEAYQQLLMGRQRLGFRTASDIEAAYEHFERALTLDPEYAPAHADLARAILLLEDSNSTYGTLTQAEVDAEALPHIEKAIALDPQLPEAYAVKGLHLMNRGKLDEALVALDRAVELNPNFAIAYMWRSMVWGSKAEIDNQIADLEKAHAIDPISAVVAFNLVNRYTNMGRTDEALEVADRTLAFNPGNLQAVRTQATALMAVGKIGDAARALIEAGDRTDDKQINQLLSGALLTLGLPDAAAKFTRFEDSHSISWAKGDYEGALSLVDLTIGREPENGLALASKAFYLFELGRRDEARQTAEQAADLLEADESNPYNICDARLVSAFGDKDAPRVQEIAQACEDMLLRFLGTDIRNGGALDGVAAFKIVEQEPAGAITAAYEKAYKFGARSWYLNHITLPDYLAKDPGFQAFMAKLNKDLERQRKTVLPLLDTLLAQAPAP